MANFDLNNYETVKERKKRFYGDYKDGRIIVEQINSGRDLLDFAEFKAYVYLSAQDQKDGLPKATGHALELRDKDMAVSRSGKQYESVNFASWTENAEESAVGRALDNAGYASSPSREEMKKVIRNTEVLQGSQSKKPVSSKPEAITGIQKSAEDVQRGVPLVTPDGKSYCSICGKGTSVKVTEFSQSKYGKILCIEHQG